MAQEGEEWRKATAGWLYWGPSPPLCVCTAGVGTLKKGKRHSFRQAHSHSAKTLKEKKSIEKVKAHELIGVTIRMLLSSINWDWEMN